MNNLSKKISIIAIIASVGIYGCSSNNQDEITQKEDENPTDQTATVKYDPDIKAIMEANCTNCHGGKNPTAGLSWTSYENVKNKANRINVRINDAENPMPPTGLMAQDSRDKIAAWIKAGFPEK